MAITHLSSAAADAMIAVALAGSLFFLDPDSARPKIALYLLLTIAPFAIVTPLIGPLIDRISGGRRTMILITLLARATLATLLAMYIESLALFPIAFGILVFQKAYSVAKSAVVPKLVSSERDLVEANSKLALLSAVGSFFGASIEQMVALAFLMPIVASMGGNAGMQTLAVTIRAIATKELSSGNFNKVLVKEFLIGILNGIIFAIITAIIIQLWFKEASLSLLISISMVLNMIVAGLFGILVPVSLKKLNIDPALASSVFVTTITDVIGFLSFLGIGSYFFLN